MQKFKGKFTECDTCAAKPGSPELCRGCYLNRTIIDRLLRGEGELLEDGTVEKYCVCASCQAGHKNGHNAMRNFLRETPQLPEKLSIDSDSVSQIEDLTITLNALIDYLKAHE